jgi:hypothetical protein
MNVDDWKELDLVASFVWVICGFFLVGGGMCRRYSIVNN